MKLTVKMAIYIQRSIALPVLCAILIAAYGCTAPTAAPIRIGALYNLSGAQASLDFPSACGAKLAVQEINRNGGLNGRQVELVLYDGRTDPAVIQQMAHKLVEQDRVAAVTGFSDTDMVLAAAPVIAASKTVFITSGATSPRLPGQVKDYLFLACFGDNIQAAAGAEYACRNLELKNVAILADSQMEYTLLLAQYFKQRFVEMGGQVVLKDTYIGGNIDLSRQLERLKALDPQPALIYLASGPDDVGGIVKQLRQAGLNMPVMGGDAYDTPLLTEVDGKYADNIFFTTHCLLDEKSGSQLALKFINAYQLEYGRLPENAFAALGYDAVNLLANALARANPDDPGSVAQSLLETHKLAAVTGDISYENGDRIPHKSVTIIKIINGRPSIAAVIMPDKVPAP